MAKKKKKEVETGRILGRLNDDGSITPFIQKQQEEDIAPVRNDNKWFKSGIDTSGYAIQNPLDAINRFNASVLMTGVDIIGQVGLGVTKPIEGVGDFAQNRVADVLDFFGGDKTAEKIRKSAAKEWGVNRELEQSLARDNDRGIDDMSFLGTKGKSIPQGVGSVLLAMGSGGLGGAIGGTNAAASVASLGIMGVGSAGNAEQEALEQGATRGEARLYGILSGASETLSEMMFGGLSKGSQVLGIGTGMFDSADDALINSLTKKINNKLVKTFTQAGLKATSEGIEEVVSGLGSAWAKKLTYMKEEDIKKLIEDENLLDSFLSGTLSAAVSQAPNVAQNITTRQDGKLRLQSNNEIRDFITNLNEQEQQVVEREIENRLGQEEKVTKKRRIEIEKQVIEDLDRGYINANTIRDVLGENYNAERDVRLNESFNEETRRTQAYENDVSKYDEKQRKTIQTAIDSGLLNNSNKTHDFVDLIAKLSADKGIDFDFTNNERIKDTGFAVEGKTVNGFIKDGKVTLNLESNQALNKTVGHEITHVLEGTELYNNLQDSLKSFIGEREWNNRISELEKTYKNVKGANIENELTSDLVGEYVFNDESFVKSLSTRNPNLFQKIFDEIKYMVKIATAGSKEARDLEKVKRAFEKAYRETSKTQEGTQYQLDNQDEKYQSILTNKKEMNLGSYQEGLSKTDKSYRYNKVNSYDIKNGGRGDNVQVAVTKNGYIANNALLSDNVKGKGEGTKIMLDLNQQSLEETGYPLRSLPEYNIVGIKNHTVEGQGLWDSLVRKGFAVKNNDNTYTMLETAPTVEEYVKQRENNTQYSVEGKEEISLSYAKQRFNRNMGKYSIGDNLEDAYLEHQLRKDELDKLYEYAKKKAYNDSELRELERRYKELTERDNPNQANEIQYSLSTAEEMEKYNEDRKNVFKQLDKDFGGGVAIWEANLDGRDYDDSVRYLKQRQSIKDKFAKENNIVVEEVKKPVEYRVAGNRSEEVQNYIKDNNITMEKLIANPEIQKEYFNQLEKAMLKDNWTQEEIDNYLSKFNDYFDSQRQRPSDDIIWPLLRFQGDIENIVEGKTEVVDNIETAKRERELIDDSPEFDKYVKKYVDQLFNTKPVLDAEEVMEEAKYNHGTTDDYSTGAYMTTDGSLLDFNSHGYRDDHRTIDAFDLSLQEFMDYGAIRMQPEGNGFEISIEPTSAQYNRLEDYIDNYLKENGDKIYVDCGKEGQVYSTSTPTSKIINDIKAYFRDGTFPKQSEYAQFMYSLSEAPKQDNQGRELTLQQQEYFKDSKVRDENGQLIEVYHGSPNEFTVFDKGKMKTGATMYASSGDGFYFTDSEAKADKYSKGGTKYSTYLNITNPFVVENKISNEAADLLYKFSQQVIENHPEATQQDIGAYELFDRSDIGQRSGTAILSNVVTEYGDEFTEFLKENGYDGIKSSVTDYDSLGEQYNYVAFESNQIKNVDNTNPTSNPDIRYQLGNNEVAPTSGWNVRSEDVRLQSAFKEAIAPLQEQVQELTKTIQNLAPSRALTEEEANEYAAQTQEAFENEAAPIRNNLTEEENQRMNMLEFLERNNMMNDERRYEKEQLENKVNPVYPTDEATPGQALSDIRDIDEVGKRDVKAYQYEHPEVKPYFQEEARGMLNDLNNSIKGERFINESQQRGQGTSYDVIGVKRFTSPEIAELLDSKYGYTYDDIRKGLNAIIEDHGAENIAIAKRIELVLDDNLRNGYTDWQTGTEIPPNQEYLNMLAEQEWQNYFDDINSQYPLDANQVQYALEQERQQEEQYKIEKSLEEMTADDINLEPFLEGLVKADERQKARQEIAKEIGNRKEYTPKKKGLIGKAIDLYKSLTNEFAVVDKFAKDVKNPTITHKIDTWNNYVPLAQTNITTAQTDINGKAIGRSVDSIWGEADKLGVKEILDEYLKHWSNVDRGKRGKGALDYSAKESYKRVQEIKEQHPEVHRLAKDCWQLYRNARHNLRDAGTISQQQSDAIGRANPHYNPFISENLDAYFTETGELKPRKTIKSAKGGAELEGLLSSEEAMKKYMYSQFDEATGNRAFLEIVKSSPNQFVLGGDDRTSYVNQDHLSVDKDGYYLTAYENGEPITARISKEMYDSLSRQTKHRVDEFINKYESILKPLEKFGNLRRKMLTELSPSFLLKNPGKDFQEAVINSKYTKDMIANYMNPQTWIELANGTGEADIFRNNYGSGLVMGQYDIDISEIDPKSKNFNFLKKLGNANEYMELITRYAEFKASRQNGASIQEAMYNAREVTTNFSRGNPIVKAFNKYGMTFLNSSVQGFDKFIRNFSGENGAKGIVNSLAKAAIFGIAPAVFNELAFGSGDDKDEEYEALPDYIKDNYYIIKTGDGNFIRIPKGRVLSVFGSAARRTIEAMEGEENAFEGYFNNVQQQIGINNPEENNIFAPLIQAMGGRKLDSGQTAGEAWYGGDIIPSRLQKERPEDQYDASIDKLSIWLGQRTGISPYKINYVLDQYTGGIGDIGLPMITEEANSDGSIIAPIKDQFTADTITDNKYVSEFYDTKGKLYTGSKATDEDVLKNKYMNSISSEMAKLYAERRDIQADDSLTKQQKYAKSQAIKAEINRLAKEGLDNYENIITSNNYAKIGDTEYYKNANGQWTKVTDDVASLGLDTEEKNEYYKVKNDIYTTKKENDGNDKPLVMQDIINSNLTPDAKVNLYTSNYKDDLIQPLVDSGMDVDSYLTYKSQNFTADKDSNGKSISGSKKQKVFDYINSMDVPYEQKLILAKSEYNSFNDNNAEIIEYIENTGMDYDERIELYKTLGFKVDGDSISW